MKPNLAAMSALLAAAAFSETPPATGNTNALPQTERRRPAMADTPNTDLYYQLAPDAIPQAGVPKGEIRGPFTLPSEAYPGTQHTWWIYVPAQYDPATPASLMIYNDGQAFMAPEGDVRAQFVMDNLIYRREIPVMIGVFINPGRRPDQPEPTLSNWGDRDTNRPTEYNTLDDKYARVIVDELLPVLYRDYNISKSSAKWLTFAANRGLPAAQVDIGALYAEGKGGLPQDYAFAYMWFNLAATAASTAETARKWRDYIAGKMTTDQVAQGQKLTRNWKPSLSGGDLAARSDAPNLEAAPNRSVGSGFFISSSGYVLANNHVIDGCSEVRMSDGARLEVVASDPQNDLALIRSLRQPPSVATFSGSQNVKIGQAVFAVGYPLRGLLASSLNMTPGAVSALAGIRDDVRFLQVTTPVQPGNSGGPLLDQNGNVVGVISSKLDALRVAGAIVDIPQNVNFAIKVALLKAFLEANSVQYLTAVTTKTLLPTVIADRAGQFTIVVECWR